ncbi:actin-like protein, putative [Plasmodium gallinaceum]|uniref:Actin-like protein, putative n=1 Tax=Plasmodium gallinaceum TaxID=5849 RepID=A0A1J1H499_PLAGA|nr:actin-like protein, putative [Plasmodium gallinaceum]CRG98170.1 actin-like protein, putative [Plasmodium gallinaceum]
MEYEEEESIPIIILDPGSWIIKIGFANDDLPKFQIPCLYIEKTFVNSRIIKFGNEAIEDYILIKYANSTVGKKEKTSDNNKDDKLLNVKMIFADPRHPLSKNSFTDLFETYNYLLNKLNIKTNDYNLLVVIPETIEKLFISNLLNWAFKNHNFLSISLIFNALAASYYYGLNTGEYGSRIVPVAENHGIFFDSMRNCEIGGYLISKYISNFVKINDNYIDYILIQNYKELNSYVSLDIDNNIKLATECNGLIKPYKIPYSNFYIDPKAEILSHEIYFQPEFLAHLPGNFYKQNIISLNQMAFESICLCPLDLRKKFLNNIILIGGVSNCTNIRERLHMELMHIIKSKNYSESVKINIKEIRMSDIASYLGCKKYGKVLFYNKKKWIKRNEYFTSSKNQIIQKLLMWANVL